MAAQKCPLHFECGTCQLEEVEELKRIARRHGLFQRFVVLEASPRTTTADIHIAVRKLMLRQGASRLMIAVDFLQKLGMFARTPGEEDATDLRSRVNSILHRLSTLCTVTGGPLLLISALGKEGYRPGRAQEPSLANYRETSEIEYSCDVAMQLEWADDIRNSNKGSAVKVLDLYVLKNRSGDTGRVRIYSLRDKACFTENDPGHRSMNSALHGLPDSFSREKGIEL